MTEKRRVRLGTVSRDVVPLGGGSFGRIVGMDAGQRRRHGLVQQSPQRRPHDVETVSQFPQ